ncbi:MAG: DUF6377 domain-containing protein [Chryseolinea sp.]
MRVWIVIGLVLGFSQVSAINRTDSLLQVLDRVLARRGDYDQIKIQRINALKQQVKSVSEGKRYALYAEICTEYEKFVYDSASTYITRLKEEAYRERDPSRIAFSKTKLGFIYLSAGMFNEALDTLLTIENKQMPDSLRSEYFGILARCYFDLSDYNGDESFTSMYTNIGLRYIDSALLLSGKGSRQFMALSAMKYVKTNYLDSAKQVLMDMISNLKLSNPNLAIAASTLGHVYRLEGDTEGAIQMHIRAAIADNMASTKETLAMLRLAELLYPKGDITRAYDYVKIAMADANFYGARHRKVQVAAIFPIIEGNKLGTAERQRRLLFIYAILITVSSVVIVSFAVIIYKQSRKIRIADRNIQAANKSLHEANTQLQEVNKHLMEANKIKEEYIGYYFNINSEYLMKISAFKQGVENKLMAKKFDDIRLVVNNINLKKEREDLYLSFDKVFLKLFPDFVSTFNSLFKDEDRIELKEGQLLNTELRIFALIRMGIHDTEKIAKILDYSINTIYNYKARLKSRSLVPNDEFERHIMQIKAI